MTIQPNNPYAVSLPPGTAPTNESGGRGGEKYTADVHGKFYTGSYYQRTFSFNVTAVTLPVIAATLASKFSLYNPPTSTVNLELVDFDLGLVLSATVVNTVGMYWQGPTLASLGTLGTIGIFAAGASANWFCGNLGGNAGQGNPYAHFVHSGTPVRVDVLATFGGLVGNSAEGPIHRDFDGKWIVPPGHVVSVAMSTGAGTASGTDLKIGWMEVPLT